MLKVNSNCLASDDVSHVDKGGWNMSTKRGKNSTKRGKKPAHKKGSAQKRAPKTKTRPPIDAAQRKAFNVALTNAPLTPGPKLVQTRPPLDG